MIEVTLPANLQKELEAIYEELQKEYSRVAQSLDFTCEGCPDNCCDSYFLHYTYAEWAYLWEGINQLDAATRDEILTKATEYVTQCEIAVQKGERPQVMCPLNNEGLCLLYKHRLLVCRTHGVPATMTRPDGKTMQFPGCFRCQEIVEQKFPEGFSRPVERTQLLRRLAMLENVLLNNKRHLVPKVKKTIAEMLVQGPPQIPRPFCQK